MNNNLPYGLSRCVVTTGDTTIKRLKISDLVVLHDNSLTNCSLSHPTIAKGVTAIVHETQMNEANISGTVRANHSVIESSNVLWGGVIEADNGCSCLRTRIGEDGYLAMMSGSYASGLTVENGGVAVISSGAVVSDTKTGGDESEILVLSGGVVSVAEIAWCDYLRIARGASASEISVLSGGSVNIGESYSDNAGQIEANASVSFLYISSGGRAVVKKGGTVENMHVSTGGSLVISSGASVNICQVKKGAYVKICEGGTLMNLCGAGSSCVEADSGSWLTYKNGGKNGKS